LPPPATTTFSLFVIALALVVPLLVFPLDWVLSRPAGRISRTRRVPVGH
jgi:hypothetical protein